MALDADAARRAIAERVAAPLGLDPLAAASGIVEIANAHMIGAMRLVSVQRRTS
jgi:N-methylhydantoinase A